MNSAKTFGEIVVVANCNNVKAKLDDHGKTCIWHGYAKDHAIGTYYVYNSKTNKVSLTRDVTFLCESHNDWVAEEEPASVLEIEVEVDAIVAAQNPVSTVNDADEESDKDGDIPPLVNYVTDSEDESDDEQEVVASPVTTVN
jgi:hypothetical protein